MDQKRSKDRNAQQPQNGQMMTELKYLKAQIVLKDKRIKELEDQVALLKSQAELAKLQAAPALPVPAQS